MEPTRTHDAIPRASTGPGLSPYAFGDSELARRRLELVATVFDPSSRAFISRATTSRPSVALDLGCGPGLSTRVVAEVTGAPRTIGLDVSEAFVAAAQAASVGRLRFLRHDVTRMPLPEAPADLIHARLLLAHLPRPTELARAWLSQLSPGGVLLLDEVESIDADHPVLADYLEIVVEMLAARGASLYVGPTIGQLAAADDCTCRYDTVTEVPVAHATAACMFRMNLATWRNDPSVRAVRAATDIDHLDAELARLAERGVDGSATWRLRQVAIEPARTGLPVVRLGTVITTENVHALDDEER
jgi:trans-aconitate 2-methyltransferase